MDDMWVRSTFFFKSHGCLTKWSFAFPQLLFHDPQLTDKDAF
jgi:hypothetical protein